MKQITNKDGDKLVVGAQALNSPTPMMLRYVFRGVLYLSTMWALLAPVMTDIPEHTQLLINKYLLLGNTIISGTIKFFGWQPIDNN